MNAGGRVVGANVCRNSTKMAAESPTSKNRRGIGRPKGEENGRFRGMANVL